jgi:hypothetical protein
MLHRKTNPTFIDLIEERFRTRSRCVQNYAKATCTTSWPSGG